MSYSALTVFAFMIAAAHPLVRVVLGPGWEETADLLQILGIGGTFQILGNVYFGLFVSKGLSRVQLLAVLVTQPLAIIAILVGRHWGTTGVAWAVSVGMILEWLVPATWGTAAAGIQSLLLLRNIVRPLVLALAVVLVVHVVVIATTSVHDALVQLLVSFAAALGSSAVVALVMKPIRADFWEVASRLRPQPKQRMVR